MGDSKDCGGLLLVLNFGELKFGLNSDTIAADGKPVSALCHGPWARIKSEVVEEVILTSCSSLKIALQNAGADWLVKKVVVDKGSVTSHNLGGIPSFNNKIIAEFAEGSMKSNVAQSQWLVESLIDSPSRFSGAPQITHS